MRKCYVKIVCSIAWVLLALSGCISQDSFVISDSEESTPGVTEQTAFGEEETEDVEDTEDTEVTPVTDELNSVQEYRTEETENKDVYVFVCGQVSNPGVYRLQEGSRICDAIAMAGGCLDTADINIVNQAELLIDGSMIYIPMVGEEIQRTRVGQIPPGDSRDEQNLSDDNTGDFAPAGKLDLNLAAKEDLMNLPGVGESKADAIIKYREEHGRFNSIEEIKNITGIKDGIFNQIKEYIMVK